MSVRFQLGRFRILSISDKHNSFIVFFSATSLNKYTPVHLKIFLSMMPTSFRGLFVTLCLQYNQVLNIFANKPDLEQLMRNSESAQWPLQAGYPGLSIKNLDEYISLFSHCLVNIQNYQGIEIIGIKSPICITRFDVASLEFCSGSYHSKQVHRFLFGKIPTKSEQNCETKYDEILKYPDKLFYSRWYCTAHFDLFFPEPADAPHIVFHFQLPAFTLKRNLFDVSTKYTVVVESRDNWSKILLIEI